MNIICKFEVYITINLQNVIKVIESKFTVFYLLIHRYIRKERWNMNIAYIRVSTVEQNEARQVEAMKQYKIDKVFQEKVSAKNTDRPKLREMLDFAREGDTIYVADFSRLARSIKDLLELVELIEAKGVQLVSIKENIDTSTATGRLMLKMISAINDFERENMLERQREGIAIAKAAGKYKGLKEVRSQTSTSNIKDISFENFRSLSLQGIRCIKTNTRQIN